MLSQAQRSYGVCSFANGVEVASTTAVQGNVALEVGPQRCIGGTHGRSTQRHAPQLSAPLTLRPTSTLQHSTVVCYAGTLQVPPFSFDCAALRSLEQHAAAAQRGIELHAKLFDEWGMVCPPAPAWCRPPAPARCRPSRAGPNRNAIGGGL